MAIEEHDAQETRCPRLGDFVPFQYCRGCGDPFCHFIISCWAVRLDIGQFLADHFTPEQIQRGLTRPPGGRLQKILDTCARYRPE